MTPEFNEPLDPQSIAAKAAARKGMREALAQERKQAETELAAEKARQDEEQGGEAALWEEAINRELDQTEGERAAEAALWEEAINRELDQTEGERAREARAAVVRARQEAMAEHILMWTEAYRIAHDGAEPPPSWSPPPMVEPQPATVYAQERTNTMAVLALVFGLFLWPLGIIFGHIAHSQIRRTGERGSGMATAGLVFGYLGIAIIILINVAG